MVIKVIKSEPKLLYTVFPQIIEKVINYKLCPVSTEQVFHGPFLLEKNFSVWALD